MGLTDGDTWCLRLLGYNIDSLVVGRTEVEELSRMTVVVNGTDQSVVNVSRCCNSYKEGPKTCRR